MFKNVKSIHFIDWMHLNRKKSMMLRGGIDKSTIDQEITNILGLSILFSKKFLINISIRKFDC